MSARQPPRALIGLLAALVLGAAAALVLARCLSPAIEDSDELWHLACGKLIVETRSVPDHDPFSFTAGATPWTNTNWLAQAFLFLVYRAGGFELIWLLGCALYVAAVALVHVHARARIATSAWASLPVLYLVLRALRTASTIRPQGWTFVLLPLALILVDRIEARPSAGRGIALGLVLALAAQLHGGFIFVFGAIGMALVAETWDVACGVAGASRRRALVMAAALGLGAVGFALHPHGLEAVLHPFRYVLDEKFAALARETEELAPPDLTTPRGKLALVPILALLGLALAFRPMLRTREVLLAVAFSHLALTNTRGLHYLAIVIAAPLTAALDAAIASGRDRAPSFVRARFEALLELEPAARIFARRAPLVLGASFVLAALVLAPHVRRGTPGELDSPLLAAHADVADIASFLAAKDPPGRMWNELETGGALIWRLYPARQVFFDGRGDLYARAGVWEEQSRIIRAEPGFEALLAGRGCDLALVTKDLRLERALRDRGWRAIREAKSPERTLVLLVRPGSPAAERFK
jgi:hypothetical protein